MSATPTILVGGTVHKPVLTATFPYSARYAKRPQTKLLDFIKELPDRKWVPAQKVWQITGVGPTPQRTLEEAGFQIEWSEEFDDIESLDELAEPRAKLSDSGGGVYIRPRLSGRVAIEDILGPGALWESSANRFWVPLSELSDVADEFDFFDEDILDACRQAGPNLAVPAGVEDHPVARLASSVTAAGYPEDFDSITDQLGDVPDWYGLNLYEYQRLGAIAAWSGFRLICDEPGLGKCVDPSTRIEHEGAITPIGKLWQDRDHRAYPDPEEPSGDLIDLAKGEIVVRSLDEATSRSAEISASHLFRQRYRGTMRTLRTASASTITCTPAHKVWTTDGWKRAEDVRAGDAVGRPDGVGLLSWTQVIDVETTDFDGYVYDLCVPDTHSYTAEGLYSHNTRTAMAAAAISAPERVLVISPPVAVTHWVREATVSRLAYARDLADGDLSVEPGQLDGEGAGFIASAPDERLDGRVVAVRAGKKIPELPDRGIVVVADSYIAGKPELQTLLSQWSPDAVIADEIHRYANLEAKRTRAAITVSAHAEETYGITGTPVLKQPAQLPGQLLVTDTIDVFGGKVGDFLDTYCRKTRFGGWEARKNKAGQLGRIMDSQVWVRRTKALAQPQLPKKSRHVEWFDVSLTDYRKATAECVEKTHELIERFVDKNERLPQLGDLNEVVPDIIRFSSPLRLAAGRSKIADSTERITDHLDATGKREDGTYDRPLIAWIWHKEVAEGLAEGLADYDVEIINGATSSTKRDRIVDDFQAGRIGVLVASITAAGVGITLTRSCDAIFVESDWVPANVSQAEDRINRIGQTRPVTITTLSAVGTMDERMHGSQIESSDLLESIMAGGDNLVSGAVDDHAEDPMLRLSDVVTSILEMALKKWNPKTLEMK